MSRLLRCPKGHTWQAPDSPGPGGDATVACPVCATPERTVLLPAQPPAGASPQEAPAPSVPGYEILNELGRGGMGVVYRARRASDGRVVALKVILPERLNNPEVVRRFRREALAASRLSHPNVVSVFGSDQEGDTHYLAMEYVPGVTLQRLVEVHGPLPVALACDFIRQAALGLQHAVEQGLVHRDVKPANLMMVTAGGPPPDPLPARAPLKVLDLGVARVYQMNDLLADSLSTLTRDGAVIGTPDYVAPEQLENPHGADTRADLYSLGCTFYFLLTGGVPFPGGTLVQKLDRQRWETPASADQLRRDVPAPVAAVVRRLMAKHPDDRYRAPGDLADALAQLARTGVLPRDHQPEPLPAAGVLRGHAGGAAAVAFTPDGRGVVSGGADRVLRLWDVEGGRERLRFGETVYPVFCVAATGSLALAGQGASVRLYALADGRESGRLGGHTGAVRCVALSGDGRLGLTGGDDRAARLWDLESGRELQRFLGHRGRVNGAALSGDGRVALTGSGDGTLRLWDTGSGKEVRAFAAPRGAVLAVAVSSDGGLALSGHFDTTLRLWETDTGRELRRFSGHGRMVAAVAFAPGGAPLASGGHDGVVRTWDPDSGAELGGGAGHAGPVASVACSPDGRSLASAGADGTVRLWRVH